MPNPDRADDQDAPKTIVIRKPEPGAMSQAELGHLAAVLPPGPITNLGGKPIPVPTYYGARPSKPERGNGLGIV